MIVAACRQKTGCRGLTHHGLLVLFRQLSERVEHPVVRRRDLPQGLSRGESHAISHNLRFKARLIEMLQLVRHCAFCLNGAFAGGICHSTRAVMLLRSGATAGSMALDSLPDLFACNDRRHELRHRLGDSDNLCGAHADIDVHISRYPFWAGDTVVQAQLRL